MSSKHWTIETDDSGIAWLCFDKDESSVNVLSTEVMLELESQLKSLQESTPQGLVIYSGKSSGFIMGADITEFGSVSSTDLAYEVTRRGQTLFDQIEELGCPTVSAINGFCLGAGLEVAASCDMRAAAESAVLGMPEVHMGLPSVIEAALLPGQIGWGRTREILLTGQTFSAAEALQMGFVQRIAPLSELDQAIASWLDGICSAAPEAVRNQKQLMNRWERTSIEEGVLAGIDALSQAYQTG